MKMVLNNQPLQYFTRRNWGNAVCPSCGKAFEKHAKHQIYCTKEEEGTQRIAKWKYSGRDNER